MSAASSSVEYTRSASVRKNTVTRAHVPDLIRRSRGHKVYDRFCVLCSPAHRIAQDRKGPSTAQQSTKMQCRWNIPAGHSPTPPLSSLIPRFSRVSWITIKSPFIIADFIPMCAGRTPYTHSQLIRCRPYLLHHRPQYPRLDQVQIVPLTPSTTSSLPYSCRPYPLHDSIKQLHSAEHLS